MQSVKKLYFFDALQQNLHINIFIFGDLPQLKNYNKRFRREIQGFFHFAQSVSSMLEDTQ